MPGPWTINTSAGPGGSVSPSGAVSVVDGGSQLFTATPSGPSHPTASWELDGTVVQYDGNTHTVSGVTTNHTLIVAFGQQFSLSSDISFVAPKRIKGFTCIGVITPQGNNVDDSAPPVYWPGSFPAGIYKINYAGGARQANNEAPGCWMLEHDTNESYQIFYDAAEQVAPFPGATLDCFAAAGDVESANAGLSYQFTTSTTDQIGIKLRLSAFSAPGILLPYFTLCIQSDDGLLSDVYFVGDKFVTLSSDVVFSSIQSVIVLASDVVFVGFVPPVPPISPIAAKFCRNVLNACLPCDDDPISNYSSEDPDPNVFCANVTFTSPLQLGKCDGGGTGFSASAFCCSAISFEDAYMCALRMAQEKVWGSWLTGSCPPPGCPPNCDLGCPPVCGPTCPPFCPPQCPPNCPITLYWNTYQVCAVNCDNGSTFSWAVPAGTVIGTSQADADYQAFSLACKLAKRNMICFITVDLPVGRAGIPYKDANGNPVVIRAKGGTPFISPTDVANPNFPTECTITALPFGTRIPYHYQVVSGSLPTGLAFDCFGVVAGTPTTNGNYQFQVKITDAIGASQTKDYEIVVGCSPDPIKYQDSGYKFFQIPSDGVPTPGWQNIAFDDSSWHTGQAAFGSGGTTCPLQSTVHSPWTVNSDLLVRRSVTLPAGATNARLKAAVDNQIIEAYVNGTLISGLFNHDFCPHYDDFNVAIPNGVLIAGKNVVAVRVRDSGLESFFDMKMTIDCPP